MHKVPYTTTMAGAEATCIALKNPQNMDVVTKLQDMHKELSA